MLRWLTAGESHGPALTAILEGLPAHVEITSEMIDTDLARRRLGVGRGARQNFEADLVTLLGGVRHGRSQGGPIALTVGNSEWPKWEKVMNPNPVDSEELATLARNAPLTPDVVAPNYDIVVTSAKTRYRETRYRSKTTIS